MTVRIRLRSPHIFYKGNFMEEEEEEEEEYPISLDPEIAKQIQDKINLSAKFLKEAGDLASQYIDFDVLYDNESIIFYGEETETRILNIFDLIDGVNENSILNAMGECGWQTSGFYC